MQTIQAVARYFPDPCGGIQTHMSELMPLLQQMGVGCKVAASQDKPQENIYECDSIEVYRYPVFPRPKEEPNHGQFPPGKFEKFTSWLQRQKAEIYHQHQWNVRCGLHHLRAAKALGMATVVSIRLPQPICLRRTLMLYGEEVCDGKIDVVRCSYCCDELTRHLPASAVKTLSHLPLDALSRISLPESAYSPLSIPGTKGIFLRPFVVPAFVAARQWSLQEMAKEADCIVTMCEWLYEMLRLNGISEEKLALCTHGIADLFQRDALPTRVERPKQQGDPLRVGFLGRWDPVKGIHILVEAVKSLGKEVPIEAIVHGVPQDEPYRKQLLDRIANDPRIQVKPQLKRTEVAAAIANFDVLAVPSQWLETGPVVVLEAHALGVPVIGSDLGGIAEKIKPDRDGLLVPAADVKAWANALSRLALDRNFLDRLRQGIQPVRTIAMEAKDTISIYERVLNR